MPADPDPRTVERDTHPEDPLGKSPDGSSPPLTGPLGDMPPEEFRRFGYQIVDWLADYFQNPDKHPVGAQVEPGALVDALPPTAPERGEPMDRILADFERQVLPHVTHWNHPGFMGYFATSASGPGVLGDLLASGLNPIGLLWQTCPALTELEQVTMRWLAELLGIPSHWFGMTLGGASVASLHAVIAARESARRRYAEKGEATDLERLTMYTSEQAHSSIEKTVMVLGIGHENCRKIPVDDAFRMRPEALEEAIQHDLANGFRPFCVVATVGTTSTSSIDPVPAIADIAEKYHLWLHVDAAYAGVAAIVPKYRHILAGCERADSFLTNPHKWLFAPMELTAFWCRRDEELRDALSLVPEYLRSQQDPRAVNFMEYSLPLGRRFRALKLWFILRYFGREGLVAILREHIRMAQDFVRHIDEHPDFERMAPAPLSLVCFRLCPRGVPETALNELNERLLAAINATGEYFLSHTKLHEQFTLRAAFGNIRSEQRHAGRFWEVLLEKTAELQAKPPVVA